MKELEWLTSMKFVIREEATLANIYTNLLLWAIFQADFMHRDVTNYFKYLFLKKKKKQFIRWLQFFLKNVYLKNAFGCVTQAVDFFGSWIWVPADFEVSIFCHTVNFINKIIKKYLILTYYRGKLVSQRT